MSILQRILGRGQPSSSDIAKQRLQLVLVHDRANISPALLETIKDDIIQAISRHIDIDYHAVKIDFTQEGRENRLVADIPLVIRKH